MVEIQIVNSTTSVLTPEGIEIATNGSHEARVWSALPLKGQGEPMTIPELQVSSALASSSGKPVAEAVRNIRKLLVPKPPRSVKERLLRTSGSQRKELDLSGL
jgi:hypothetical protein